MDSVDWDAPVVVIILDTITGKTATADWGSLGYWGVSNGCCDCNRAIVLNVDYGEENICKGCQRFIIVDASAGCLNFLNEEYSYDLGGCCVDCKEICE
jgi:hypothetical protein